MGLVVWVGSGVSGVGGSLARHSLLLMLSLLSCVAPLSWHIQPAAPSHVRLAAGLCVDEFTALPLPLLPFPGWKRQARERAIDEWAASRRALLASGEPHALIVGLRDAAEAGRFFEGVDDGLLGFAELGLLPPPPEGRAAAAEPAGEAIAGAEAATVAAEATAAAAAAAAAAEPPMYPYIANVAVRVGARRLGLGRALVEEAERTAVELGFDRLYIKVDRQNFGARRLYDRLGYEICYLQNRPPDRTNKQRQMLFLRKAVGAGAAGAGESAREAART